MTNKLLNTVNSLLDQSLGPYFYSLGLETPHLKSLATVPGHSGQVKGADRALGFSAKRPPKTPPLPSGTQAEGNPGLAKPQNAPASQGHIQKPGRSASRKSVLPARTHSFTPAARHPVNALAKIEKKHSAPKAVPHWLSRSMQKEGIKNPMASYHIHAVRDYLAAGRSGTSGDGSEVAMKRAGKHMAQLEALMNHPRSRDPKSSNYVSPEDRKAVAATKKIYEGYRKLGYGHKPEDPDIRLLKLSFENRKRAASQSPEANREWAQPASKPKRVDYEALAKQSRKFGHRGPKTVLAAHSGKPHGPLPKRVPYRSPAS